MRVRTASLFAGAASTALFASAIAMAPPAAADAKPGSSMTHIRTAASLASTLEGAGVIAYSQGTATSQVIGSSLAASDSAYLFHVPISSTKTTVKHRGGSIVLFNTTNNQQVVLQNPAIDLRKGTVSASVPGVSKAPVAVFRIANPKAVKAQTTTEDGVRKVSYAGARLVLAPGVAGVLTAGLGLPADSLPDGAAFGTADVTVYSD